MCMVSEKKKNLNKPQYFPSQKTFRLDNDFVEI